MRKILLIGLFILCMANIAISSQITGGGSATTSLPASSITAGTLGADVLCSSISKSAITPKIMHNVAVDSVAASAITPNQLSDDASYRNEGLIQDISITDVAGVSVAITATRCLIRSTTYFGDSKLYLKTIAANNNLAMTDNSINFIYVNWNSGTPIYGATTNRDLINNATIIPVSRIYMSGGNIEYKMDYGKQGLSTAIKNFDRVMRTRGITGIEREIGYAVTCSTTYVTIESGKAWFGMYRISNNFIGQSGTNTELYTHNAGGGWISKKVAAIPTTWYDTNTGTLTLTANRYAVIWVFRNLNAEEIDLVLGTGDYTLAQAQASQIPSLPDAIQYFYTICGKIIIQKSATSPTSVQSVVNTVFTAAPTNNHSDLTSLTADDHTQYMNINGTRGMTTGTTSWLNTGKNVGFTVRDGSASYTNDAGANWSVIGSGGGGGAPQISITRDIPLKIPGLLFASNEIVYAVVPYKMQVTSVTVSMRTPPTGGQGKFEVKYTTTGVNFIPSAFKMLIGTCTIEAAQYTNFGSTVTAKFSSVFNTAGHELPAGSMLYLDCLGTGASATPGNDVVVNVHGYIK